MRKAKSNFEELEDVEFKIGNEAFKPKTLSCSKCDIQMKKSGIEINLEGEVSIKVLGFECPKCKKRYLGLEEAKKLDKALIISRLVSEDFKMERSLSFDGDNFIFRVPKEFTHDVHKKKVDIIPLGAKQFCALVK